MIVPLRPPKRNQVFRVTVQVGGKRRNPRWRTRPRELGHLRSTVFDKLENKFLPDDAKQPCCNRNTEEDKEFEAIDVERRRLNHRKNRLKP